MRVPVTSARGRAAPTKHRCPAPTCRIWVPMRRLACNTHWYSLPEQLRADLDATYRRDTQLHLQLFREAIRLFADPAREGASK